MGHILIIWPMLFLWMCINRHRYAYDEIQPGPLPCVGFAPGFPQHLRIIGDCNHIFTAHALYVNISRLCWIIFRYLAGKHIIQHPDRKAPARHQDCPWCSAGEGTEHLRTHCIFRWIRHLLMVNWCELTIFPIGSMYGIYMLTWRGYIDGKCYHIWHTYGSYGFYDWLVWWFIDIHFKLP